MTRKELRQKAQVMKRKLNKDYDIALEKLIKSGCVDLPSQEADYSLIYNFICAFCEDQASAWGYGPGEGDGYARKQRKEIKNIRHFI